MNMEPSDAAHQRTFAESSQPPSLFAKQALKSRVATKAKLHAGKWPKRKVQQLTFEHQGKDFALRISLPTLVRPELVEVRAEPDFACRFSGALRRLGGVPPRGSRPPGERRTPL